MLLSAKSHRISLANVVMLEIPPYLLEEKHKKMVLSGSVSLQHFSKTSFWELCHILMVRTLAILIKS